MNLNATDRGRVPQVGDLVGEKYRITAVLGQGGMGVVFRAVHQHTGREVALKTIKPALAQSLDFQNRFESEARAIGALRHPNIVDVTDFGYSGEGDNRFPYLVLELLDGYPLAQTLQSGPGLPWFWAISILEQVCQAVAEAHRAGVVHGDLKPENVWLRPRATTGFDVKVVDFGLARFGQAPRSSPETITAAAIEPAAEDASLPIEDRATLVRPTSNAGIASSIAGTPAYMSPERWRGEPLSPATDIYSLGVMAYRMLTGRLPHSGPEPRANETPENVAKLRPDVPAHAAQAVMSALSPDAKARPASARAFLDLLHRPAMDASPRRSLFPVHSFAVLTRALSRRPLQTAVVVLTLALGIGAATSVFSIMNGVLFQALPFKDPEALVRVYDTQPACATCPASVAKLDDWKRRNRVFAAIGGVTVTPRTLTGLGDARRIRVARTTASMADVLGVPPLIGRWFTDAEDQPGGPALVLLSFETWTSALNRDPGVVGRKLLLDGLPHEVVGVMPATFTLQRADVYVPLQEAVDPAKRGNHFIPAYARLKAGVGIEEATRDMRSLGETLAREFGHNHGIDVQSLQESMVGAVRPQLRILAVAAFLLLAIACANAGSLLLASGLARLRELSIRVALGATRAGITGLLVVEGVAMSLIAGALGVALSWLVTTRFLDLAANQLPRAAFVRMDIQVLGFSFLLTLLVGILCSAWPAWALGRRDLAGAIREGDTRSGTRAGKLVGGGLVVVEVALAFALIVVSSLLMKDLSRLRSRDAGFNAERVITFEAQPAGAAYPTEKEKTAFYIELARRLERMGGVEAVGLTSHLPMVDWGWNSEFQVDRKAPWPADKAPLVDFRWVHGNYLQMLGVPLLRGRLLDETDGETALTVVINKTMAERFWPGEDPIGRRFGSGDDTATWFQVAGVVGDIRSAGLVRAPLPEFYRTIQQSRGRAMTVLLKSAAADPATLMPQIRSVVESIDPTIPITSLRTLEDAVSSSVGQQRLVGSLTAFFGFLAAVLASLGVFSVMSYAVRTQLREFAVRLAMGAQQSDILRLVTRRSAALLATGITLGVIGSLSLMGLLRGVLHDVSPGDPVVFAACIAAVLAAGVVATAIPARTAASAQPLLLLRSSDD